MSALEIGPHIPNKSSDSSQPEALVKGDKHQSLRCLPVVHRRKYAGLSRRLSPWTVIRVEHRQAYMAASAELKGPKM
jgi:hypothetical protein